MRIRYPVLSEVAELSSVLFSAFTKDFSYLFGKDFEVGRKLFVGFYEKLVKEKYLKNFLVATIDHKIVGVAQLDFEDPKLVQLAFFLLRLNLHFFRSYSIVGIKRAVKIMLGMYWFLFEDFNTNSSYIKLLGVLPEYQNRKIGTKMLQVVEKITIYKHLSSMTLDVTFEDLPARHLYKKMGFSETRRFQNAFMKYLNGIEGAISMEKKMKYKN
jgi:ribosomal protein S18 acetylase RimI-like enzyme